VQLDIHYWAVTNYNEFTFGSFSESECRLLMLLMERSESLTSFSVMTNVFLTETLKCDRSDPSISEAMFFWTMSSVNADTPLSFKIPSVCIEIY
jgi:hypothetical protein